MQQEKTGEGYEAHHTLPQKYEKEFNEAGINIHEPGNTVWREKGNHRAKSHQHIKEWDNYFDGEDPIDQKKIIEKRNDIETRVYGNTQGDI